MTDRVPDEAPVDPDDEEPFRDGDPPPPPANVDVTVRDSDLAIHDEKVEMMVAEVMEGVREAQVVEPEPVLDEIRTLRSRPALTMLHAFYICTNEKCKVKGTGKRAETYTRHFIQENDTVMAIINCWNCHAGVRLRPEQMMELKRGMQLVNQQKITYMPIGVDDIIEEVDTEIRWPEKLPKDTSREGREVRHGLDPRLAPRRTK